MVKQSSYKCPHCGGQEFRAESHNSVDVELDADGSYVDIGFNWSDEDLTGDYFCNSCGQSVKD